jgi:hypothetical protein
MRACRKQGCARHLEHNRWGLLTAGVTVEHGEPQPRKRAAVSGGPCFSFVPRACVNQRSSAADTALLLASLATWRFNHAFARRRAISSLAIFTVSKPSPDP